jgi:hypothetical protein
MGSLLVFLLSFQLLALVQFLQVEAQGSWEVVVENAGIASMHTAVTIYNNVVLLDRTDIGPSQLPLPDGECRNDPNDEVSEQLVSFQLLQLRFSSFNSCHFILKFIIR